MRYPLSIFMLLAAGGVAFAQSTNQPPASPEPDFAGYSQFIATRNIFNPDRVPQHESSRRHSRPHTATAAPYIALVGIMDYPKGLFAFFDANNSEYRKVLQANDHLAGYTITDITHTGVVLTPTVTGTNAAPTNTLQLTIGTQLRQNGQGWELATANDIGSAPAPADAASDSAPAPAAHDSSSEPNDILKRLMQKREQETK